MTKTKLTVIIGLLIMLCIVPFAFADGNKLSIEEVKVTVDGKKDSGTIDVMPESTVKVKVNVESLYLDSDVDKSEIEDIQVTVTLEGIDDGEDLEEEEDIDDLDPGDDDSVTVIFDLPLELDHDNDYFLRIEVTGEDRENKSLTHRAEWETNVRVKKENHDVQIRTAELSSPILTCSRTTSLDVDLINMGKDDEEGELKVSNIELELSKQASFELSEDALDDDSKFSQSFPITISNDQEAGIYPINIKVDYGSKTTEEVVELIIEDCEKTKPAPIVVEPEEEEEQEEEVIVEKQETVPEVTTPTTAVTAETPQPEEEEGSIFSGTALIALIIGADLLIIIIGVALIVGLAKKK